MVPLTPAEQAGTQVAMDCMCTYVSDVGVSVGDHPPCLSLAKNRRERERAVCALRQCRMLPAPSGEPLSATDSMSRHQAVLGHSHGAQQNCLILKQNKNAHLEGLSDLQCYLQNEHLRGCCFQAGD